MFVHLTKNPKNSLIFLTLKKMRNLISSLSLSLQYATIFKFLFEKWKKMKSKNYFRQMNENNK